MLWTVSTLLLNVSLALLISLVACLMLLALWVWVGLQVLRESLLLAQASLHHAVTFCVSSRPISLFGGGKRLVQAILP